MTPSITNRFTEHLHQAIAKAFDFAFEFGHEFLTEEHLLYGLAAEKGSLSAELLQKNNFPVDLLKQDLIRKYHTPYLRTIDAPALSDDVVTILTKAVRVAHEYSHPYIGTEHVLWCLLQSTTEDLRELLVLWRVNFPELQKQAQVVLKSTTKFVDINQTLQHIDTSQPMGEEEPQVSLLESLCKEMTKPEATSETLPLVGREKELLRLQQILCRKYKNNPLLVGKPGVGKTAIVEGLAQLIQQGATSHLLHGKKIYSLELSHLVAGTMYRGDFEQRVKMLLQELQTRKDVIVFIDEIHTLVGAGSSGQPLDAANMLKPALARGEIRCIGATTWEEYQQHFKNDSALTRRFQTIHIDEPSTDETKQIIEGIKEKFESFHNVSIQNEAIEAAIDLSHRYLTHTNWPDKAIDVLDEAAAQQNLQAKPSQAAEKKKALKAQIKSLEEEKSKALHSDNYEEAITLQNTLSKHLEDLKNLKNVKVRKPKLSLDYIRSSVAVRTGIDAERLHLQAEPIAQRLFGSLSQHIIGQEKSLTQLCKSIQRGQSFLKEPQKPQGAYLFLGPSGVGKTATAKVLAKELFGSEKALIRLDMSEYGEKFTTSKLIGAPAGYVGYENSGLLTSQIQERPLSVVLFDEVEKAHPDVFNLLLQILDEGVLTDGSGKKVDFRHSVIILTSNLGLKELQKNLGFTANSQNVSAAETTVRSAVKEFFRTEFLNRLDDIIYYQPLGLQDRKVIIKKMIADLNTRLKDQFELIASETAIELLAQKNYREEQGARSLAKNVKELIEYPLSEQLWQFPKGKTIQIETKDESIRLS